MDIINNITQYFPTIGGYVRKTNLLYNQIAPIVEAISLAKDCELFPPNSNAIKKALKESGDFKSISIIDELKKPEDSSNSIVLNDPFITRNELISDVIQNINSKFYESLSGSNDTLIKSILNQIQNDAISIGDPCKILEKDVLDALKRSQKINSDFSKTLNEDSEAFKILQRCKEKPQIINSLREPEIWSAEELQNIIDNCLIPDEVQVGLSNDLTGTPNINSVDTNFEEDDDVPTEGDGLTLDEIFNNFKKAAESANKEDNAIICAEKIFNASKFLQESARSDSKERLIELNLKIDLEYETLFNEGIKGAIIGASNGKALNIGIGLQTLKIESLQKYTDEISIQTKTLDYNVRSAKIPTGFIKKRNKNEGVRFKIEEKYGKILRNKKIESVEKVNDIIEKKDLEIQKLFNSYKKIVRDDGYDSGRNYINKFSPRQKDRIISNLENTKTQSDERLDNIISKLDTIKKEKIKREEDTKKILKELEDLKCDNSLRVAKNIPDSNIDFRGAPNDSNPTILDADYWRRFAELASIVGLLPIPQFIGSNDFKMQFIGEDADVKIPSGSIAIDDDGIPRFLFWPIGLPIPIPKPPDFLLRIPVPMGWKYITKFELKNPLKDLEERLTKIHLDTETLRDLAFIISEDDPLDVAYSKISNNSLDTIIKLMGVSENPVLTYALQEISKINNEILEVVKSELFNYIRNNSFDIKEIINNEASKPDIYLNKWISELGVKLQEKIEPITSKINDAILSIQESINFEAGGKNLLDYLNEAKRLIQTAEDILKTFGSCAFKDDDLEEILDTTDGANNGVTALRDATDYVVNTPFDVGDLALPFLKISEYLGVSQFARDQIKVVTDKIEEYKKDIREEIKKYREEASDDSENSDGSNYFKSIEKYKEKIMKYVEEKFTESEIYEMLPALKLMGDIITGKLLRQYYNIIKASLMSANFDFRSLLDLPNLNRILTNIPLVQLNFPHLLFVFFIGFNPLPYPFLLCINLSNAPVPGLIEPNAIKFIITADFTNPIKLIKKNWGSHTVPIKTQIEGIINSSMGLGFSYKNGIIPNLCESASDLKNLKLNRIIEEMLIPSQLSIKHLKNLPKKNLYNLIEWPNPNIICKMMQAQGFKENFKKELNKIKLKNSNLPPTFSKAKKDISKGLSDLNGKLKMDELKKTFNVEQFPNIADIIPMDESKQSNFTFADTGITANAIFDLLPELTKAAPYVQDDLPCWERLHLGNVPFVFFLAEFLVAAKKGAKFPIPEVNPLLEMN